MPDDAEDAKNALLRGLVLCSTSLSQDLRDKLNDLARSMGAIHRLDLTADVTHLIVGNIDTPKCRHTAKERPDIHVLKPEWIHAIRKAYMEDQDIDLDALVQEHRLPVFYNLHISVTGFEDIEERQNIIEKIRNNGAHYHGDLTREVTHLIVAKPKGAKYERAQSWNIKTVSLKWLEESLDRGMAVDESLYHPLMSLEDQGKGAFVRGYQRPPVLGKRQREGSAVAPREEIGKRKMRRTASAKLADHSQNMMTSFLSLGGEESSEVTTDQWTENPQVTTPPRSLSPPRRSTNISRPPSWGTGPVTHEEEPGLFSGISCLVHGHDEKKAAKIDDIITSNGGQVTRHVEAFCATQNGASSQRKVLILPSEWTSTNMGSLPEVSPETWLATEWWLERCIKHKTIVDPDHDILSQPHLSLPIDGFEGLRIATSGMGHDVLHISKVVRLAGASYDEVLLPKTSILVVPGTATNPEKIAYAAKHKIPVVSDTWLYSSLQHARKMPMNDYMVAGGPKQMLDRQYLDHPSREASVTLPQDKRKDILPAQRLSAVRKRNVATSLHLYQSGPVQPAQQQPANSKRRGPFIEEDEEEEMPDGRSHPAQGLVTKHNAPSHDLPPVAADDSMLGTDIAQPLQNIPPEVNATRRQSKSLLLGDMEIRSTSSSAQKDVQQARPGSDENADAIANQVRLSGEIRSLLERQHSHSGSSTVEQPAKGRWRKDKRLGRAPSYTSNSSTSVSFRQHPNMDVANSGALASMMENEVPAPSQQVTYETPEAQEYRAKMSKKMGTRLMDDSIGTRVESPGLVRDVDESDSTGVGARVRGRQRTAKNAL
ncbi:hypothetical protein KCU95_g13708, partial [Aureobasidium melanogenum]